MLLGKAAQNVLGGALGNAQNQTLEDQIYHQTAQNYRNALAQSMMNTAQQTKAQTLMGAYGSGAQAKSTFDPNKIEAYQVPLSQLITLWQAKFNDTWVDMGIEHEPFWRSAYRRLENANMFERAEGWVRLLEDA